MWPPVSEKCSLESHWWAWASVAKMLLATGPVLSDMTSSQATTWQGGGGCELLQNEIWVEGFGLRGQKGPKKSLPKHQDVWRKGVKSSWLGWWHARCPKLKPNLKRRLYEAVAGGICTQIGLGLNEEFLTCEDNGCVPGIPAIPRPWILHCHVGDLVKWMSQKTSKGGMWSSGVACTCSRPKGAVSLLMKVRAWVDQTTGMSPCLFVPSNSVRKDPEPNPQVLFLLKSCSITNCRWWWLCSRRRLWTRLSQSLVLRLRKRDQRGGQYCRQPLSPI